MELFEAEVPRLLLFHMQTHKLLRNTHKSKDLRYPVGIMIGKFIAFYEIL
jgi:hypothetical protein